MFQWYALRKSFHRLLCWCLLSVEVETKFKNYENIFLVLSGAACLALYSDDRWYRAEIIDIAYGDENNGGDLIAVRYVDYGSFEFLDYSRYT